MEILLGPNLPIVTFDFRKKNNDVFSDHVTLHHLYKQVYSVTIRPTHIFLI